MYVGNERLGSPYEQVKKGLCAVFHRADGLWGRVGSRTRVELRADLVSI